MAGKEETMVGKQKLSQPEEAQTIEPTGNRRAPDLYQVVLKTYVEQSEGWKKRNLFERQWLSRDFKKTTGISIDEMQTTLKALGNTLRVGASNAEFIGPLNQLSGYYKHQQEQLKGFEKNPQKLEENLKIIEGWIKDA